MELQQKIDFIKDVMKNNRDIIFRKLVIGELDAVLIFVQDITSFSVISDFIIQPLIHLEKDALPKKQVIDFLIENVLEGRDVNKQTDLQSACTDSLKGKVLLLVDGEEEIICINAGRFSIRPISEPPTSSVVNGPREGFTESIKVNISMVRRRLATPSLKIDTIEVGSQTRTLVKIVYLTDVAQNKIVRKVTNKIKNIKIDGIIDSNYIVQYLKYRKNSIFRQVGKTEKPDIATAKILEGRVAIFVDGSPVVLTVPFLVFESFQNSDDYYEQNHHATFIRWLRFVGSILSVLLPGIYAAVQLYHYSIIPLNFWVTIANTTQGLPFSPLFEILFVILLFEILNEASVRMPKYYGMSMSIVGALILGDTAVKAGVISPPAVMIVALSSITIFTVPYLATELSLLRIAFTLVGGMLGLYGIILGIIFLISYMNDLDNYGSPFLAPLAPKIKEDYQDYLNMSNIVDMTKRPKSIKNKNSTRRGKSK